ncbi:MAG: Crp/Fnr family transcriptional regulator [Bernardetiaceae bacterium]|jgi:CRP-like cAMP-binding protein|nr:Crp/Fnr family transcriptional regulator [Bernardetiaceae bacterium]
MTEIETLQAYVARHIQLSAEEQAFFASLLRVTPVRKKQLIAQPEFVCRYRSYVYRGAMRAYLVDKNATEHTIAFAVDDWWISDYSSFIFQQPATLFVEALEDSMLVQIDYNAEQLLMETVPKFERFFRIITQRAFAFLQQRMLSNLSKTAEERYDEFQQKYPAIVQRVPQYTLASYLGMTTEYLSKLRKRKASQKS